MKEEIKNLKSWDSCNGAKKEEKIIMNFCGCDVVLRTTDSRLLDRAEKEIKRIFDKEFPILNKRELRKIVERDLGVKKHWFWGWIKNN